MSAIWLVIGSSGNFHEPKNITAEQSLNSLLPLSRPLPLYVMKMFSLFPPASIRTRRRISGKLSMVSVESSRVSALPGFFVSSFSVFQQIIRIFSFWESVVARRMKSRAIVCRSDSCQPSLFLLFIRKVKKPNSISLLYLMPVMGSSIGLVLGIMQSAVPSNTIIVESAARSIIRFLKGVNPLALI